MDDEANWLKSEDWETEEGGASLVQEVQMYLAQQGPTTTCCGVTIPIAFERAADRSWWDPRFDSEILENQYRSSSFQQIRLRFRFALGYVLIFSLSWFIYFVTLGVDGAIVQWPFLCSIFAGVMVATTSLFIVTITKKYATYTLQLSLVFAIALCLLSLSLLAVTAASHVNEQTEQNADITQAGHFTMCIEILLIIYTVTPMPLYMCVLVGVAYSILFEVLTGLWEYHSDIGLEWRGVLVRSLLHFGVHVLGSHLYLMTFVRMRGTFMKVGQSLLVRQQLEMERQLKEKMIHSVMPPKLATSLMKDTGLEGETNLQSRVSNPRPSDVKSLFRPFNMTCMDNVSILFADIVGFTRMSSNKSAEELVSILNDLFERFDELCKTHGCEKISTLGDCYYCVSGCPEPRPDHATCCVEMGLGMIDAIREFDAERGEGVNMRVGVHTGTVLCGIVGTRRFKFDVWSNDVSLANKMEATGQPGRVHITEETSEFLSGCYVLEETADVEGHKTFFIEGRRAEERITPSQPVDLKLIISPAASVRSSSPPPHAEAPVSHLLSPYQPHMRVKANSLPSILDSEEGGEKQGFPRSRRDNLSSKSPTSVGGYNKYATRLMSWRVPRFLRKHSDSLSSGSKREEGAGEGREGREGAAERERSKSNGYQQVPTVLTETPLSLVPPAASSAPSPSERCLDRELIDIRSYLSQSRNKLSPFARTSSYRSQYGRASHVEVPPCRARSSTMTHAPPHLTRAPRPRGDNVSLCPSVDSRKDSGIPSTSRRSSIQQQIYALNQSAVAASQDLHQRVSGYYTSSQSSVSSAGGGGGGRGGARLPPPRDLGKIRKQSDLMLIKCVQENSQSGVSYFVQPPLWPHTLFFRSAEMERLYRSAAHRSDDRERQPPTLATSRFNTALDVIVSCVVFALLCGGLALLGRARAGLAALAGAQAAAVALCGYRHRATRAGAAAPARGEAFFRKVSDWYPWQASGSVLVSLPLLAVLLTFSCAAAARLFAGDQPYHVYLFCVGVVHFCNFTQINWLIKNALVSIYALVFLALVAQHCARDASSPVLALTAANLTADSSGEVAPRPTHPAAHLRELYMSTALLLLLVWFLNREFEICYRLSFHSDVVAHKDKSRVQNMRNQADWLLCNIIPKDVAEQLKCTAKYSENHKCVGIIFASIVNFNEMYEESYLKGKEYLRVLNELIADFDELLGRPEFASIEKIKTIGSTFMAASGLNAARRGAGDEHLAALLDFAVAMQEVIANFNVHLLEFALVLRVGYNCGDVTAGVIGTTKLYYDIWGDAVNIASRMDSTGVPGRIQLGEACLPRLPRYRFERRGSVYVKGKDDMDVYLYVGKR